MGTGGSAPSRRLIPSAGAWSLQQRESAERAAAGVWTTIPEPVWYWISIPVPVLREPTTCEIPTTSK
ncbi:MAG: hypothetical protein QM767_26370 [Anaeromyxobacter sp.]